MIVGTLGLLNSYKNFLIVKKGGDCIIFDEGGQVEMAFEKRDSMKRVKYHKSPLRQVIFQLRFPTILSINTSQPTEFQERIRGQFPIFNENLEEYGDIFVSNHTGPTPVVRKVGEQNYQCGALPTVLHQNPPLRTRRKSFSGWAVRCSLQRK